MKKIALLTSGGDAPGMNAAIRAVVRMGICKDLEVYGIQSGYQGLIEDQLRTMTLRSVSNIIHRGGTVLKTARSQEFMTEEGQRRAAYNLEKRGIDGLIIIGGNGSFKGAVDLCKVWNGQVIGVPGTIDNDLYGTDNTIGYHTAVHTALECIDKIRDTAESHDRTFYVEVMGRHSGFIALSVAVSCGAEEVILPETPIDLEEVSHRLTQGLDRGKSSGIVIVAEGCGLGNAEKIAKALDKHYGHPYRVVVLGHIQRGGVPIATDRLLASKLGAFAVQSLLEGKSQAMAGEIGNQVTLTPLKDAIEKRKDLDPYLLEIFHSLAL